MNFGKELFQLNRSILNTNSYKKLLDIETPWTSEILGLFTCNEENILSKSQFQEAFDYLLLAERSVPSSSADYLSSEVNISQFRIVIQEFAVDGLTEAQSFFPIISRLPLRAQMPILRVLIDEFGCGNLNQAHSQLYTDLLSELDMPTNIESYLDDLNQESYAFLNIFYWLTQRASNIEYFLGALAYLESMIPFTFKCFAEACQRLGILNSKYYTEHIHIDGFHSKDALRAIKEVELAANLCYSKVWIGVKIASLITNQAFDAAILKSKKAPNVLINSAKNSDFIAETEPDLTINHKETFSIELKDKQIRIQGDCPHRAGKLRAGIINVDNGTITCPLHFSKFNIETGKLISGPACSSLHVCNVTDRSNL